MKQYLLPESGNFYKANLHRHTVISDGSLTPEEVKEAYLEKGFSIVAYTDHEMIVDHSDLEDENFLPITSYELSLNATGDLRFGNNVPTYHINFYAKDKHNAVLPCFNEDYIWAPNSKAYITDEMRKTKYDFKYSVECINDIIKKVTAAGFLACYNHPVWSMHSYPDYAALEGLWGVEWYNSASVCGGYPDTIQPVDDLLKMGKRVCPIAADDAHSLRAAFGGWVMVKADKLEYSTIMDALERGDLYSSIGPQINELYIEDGIVHIETSEAREIMLTTERRVAMVERGDNITSANFDINKYLNESREKEDIDESRSYFRITVTDHEGYVAHTRAYFVDEIK
ncbi:MAG: hypothetical protein IJZ89_04430 [Clostridia bacterium]|nr:hypothetical protein [Clostridia bacterium]